MSFERCYLITLCLFTGLWILFPHFTSFILALFGFTVVYGIIKKELVFTFHLLPALLVLLYILYLVYAIPTNHLPIALDFLEYKLSLLAFPFVLAFEPKFRVNWKYVFYSFLIAVLLLVIYYLAQASIHYVKTGMIKSFYSSALSPTHHPTYLTVFLSLAIMISLRFAKSADSPKLKIIFWGIIGLLVLLHVPLSSLSGMLFLVLFFSIAFIYSSVKLRKWSILLITALTSGIIVFSALKVQPSLSKNIENVIVLVNEYADSPKRFVQTRPFPMQGNEARLVLWTVAFDIFKEHHMGVGLGNLEEMMHQRLVELGLNKQADLNYNPHNQYLQIAGELGIIGLLLFLGILLYGVIWAISSKNWLLTLVMLSLMFNCFFESMLQRQSGIVFYCFWICILTSVLSETKTKFVLKE